MAQTLSSFSTFVSALIVAFTAQPKLAVILFFFIPLSLFIFISSSVVLRRLGGELISELSYATAFAKQVLSSVVTAQAFGVEKLVIQYDHRLIKGQRIGLKKALVFPFMLGTTYSLLHLNYGLAFCILRALDKSLIV